MNWTVRLLVSLPRLMLMLLLTSAIHIPRERVISFIRVSEEENEILFVSLNCSRYTLRQHVISNTHVTLSSQELLKQHVSGIKWWHLFYFSFSTVLSDRRDVDVYYNFITKSLCRVLGFSFQTKNCPLFSKCTDKRYIIAEKSFIQLKFRYRQFF